MKNRQIIVLFNLLSEIASFDRPTRMQISGKARIKLAANLGVVRPLYENFETERVKLVKEFGEPFKDKPDDYEVKPDNLVEFNSIIGQMLDTDMKVELDVIKSSDLLTPSGECSIPMETISKLIELGVITK